MCAFSLLRSGAAGFALLIVSALAAQAATAPILDDRGTNIGAFDAWGKRKVGRNRVPEPVGWLGINNGLGGKKLFKQLRESGGSAVQGTVLFQRTHGRGGISLPPRLEAGSQWVNDNGGRRANGVPVTTRHAAISGRYRFHSVQGSGLLIFIRMQKAGVEIGQGSLLTKTEVRTATPLRIPVTYFTNETPDRCLISFDIAGKQEGNRFQPPAKGSYFVLDQFTFSD